jgi:hypothetical protein
LALAIKNEKREFIRRGSGIVGGQLKLKGNAGAEAGERDQQLVKEEAILERSRSGGLLAKNYIASDGSALGLRQSDGPIFGKVLNDLLVVEPRTLSGNVENHRARGSLELGSVDGHAIGRIALSERDRCAREY